MKRFFTQLITGRDNVTADVFRVLALVAVPVGIALDAFVVIWKAMHPDATVSFDLIAYGTGIGGLLLAVGGALKLKAETEPSESTMVATSTTTSTVTEKVP